jgi:hypothetical protein
MRYTHQMSRGSRPHNNDQSRNNCTGYLKIRVERSIIWREVQGRYNSWQFDIGARRRIELPKRELLLHHLDRYLGLSSPEVRPYVKKSGSKGTCLTIDVNEWK